MESDDVTFLGAPVYTVLTRHEGWSRLPFMFQIALGYGLRGSGLVVARACGFPRSSGRATQETGVFGDRPKQEASAALAEAGLDRGTVARVLAGETERFGDLVERYAARVYTLLFRIVRHREDAEDLAQETFAKAYRALRQLDPERPFRNWLYAIATNTGLNALRAHRRRGLGTSVAYDEASVVAGPVVRAHLPSTSDDTAGRVADAVGRLPERTSMLVHLHYYEGLSVREAAEILGLSESAAKVALHRARKCLREWLVEGDGVPGTSREEGRS